MIFLGSNQLNALVPHSWDSQLLSVWQGSNHLQDRSGQCETGIFRYGDTVDGSDIRRSPVDMVNIPLFSWVLYIQTVVFSPDFWTINSINRRIAILLVTSFGGTEDAEVTNPTFGNQVRSRPLNHLEGKNKKLRGSLDESIPKRSMYGVFLPTFTT